MTQTNKRSRPASRRPRRTRKDNHMTFLNLYIDMAMSADVLYNHVAILVDVLYNHVAISVDVLYNHVAMSVDVLDNHVLRARHFFSYQRSGHALF